MVVIWSISYTGAPAALTDMRATFLGNKNISNLAKQLHTKETVFNIQSIFPHRSLPLFHSITLKDNIFETAELWPLCRDYNAATSYAGRINQFSLWTMSH